MFAGHQGVENSQYVDNVSTCARQALQEHIRNVRPSQRLRYSQLLLCLPTLYSINCKMMENLFCKHITATAADIEVLLKEMMQKA